MLQVLHVQFRLLSANQLPIRKLLDNSAFGLHSEGKSLNQQHHCQGPSGFMRFSFLMGILSTFLGISRRVLTKNYAFSTIVYLEAAENLSVCGISTLHESVVSY